MQPKSRSIHRLAHLLVLGLLTWTGAAFAQPVVSTVPADPNDALQTHDVISGRATTLKGAVDEASIGSTWTWDPGDGSPTTTGNVDANPVNQFQLDDVGYNPYWAIWTEHTYTGNDGDILIATLTVDNGVDAPVSNTYRVQIRQLTLPAEVNASIDEALWHMHRNQLRFNGNLAGGTAGGTIPMGRWDYPQTGGQVTASVIGATVNAFEANGYLENGPTSSPYTDTVARGLRYLFSQLTSQAIAVQTFNRPAGQGDDPDILDNDLGVRVNGIDPPYQGGMVMDAIIASGTPDAVATTGPANVIGRTYGDIIQDMVDYYLMAQGDGATTGGWRYGPWNNTTGQTDNSTNGWAAIGLVAAEDLFGATVPQWLRDRNMAALELTDNESNTSDSAFNGDGIHGYTNAPNPAWGPYGTSGAAMVQMVMDNIQATSSATPDERWIRTENMFRRRFNDAAIGNNFKNYYYGMFNFAKAMRTARPAPVEIIGTEVGVAQGGVGCGPSLACAANGPQPLDWYNDITDGLARTVVDYQVLAGVNIGQFSDRPGNSSGSRQDEHNTPWATQILTRTLFQAGPVARATAAPNPTGEGVPVSFDSSTSSHQDPARGIVQYQWDFDNDGTFDASTAGPDTVMQSFTCPPPGVPCFVPVTLRVTDDNDPALSAQDTVIVEVTIPPRPPTAVDGGAYIACVGEGIALDGSGSFDIDEGVSESGNPPFDTITAYDWDLDLASGAPFDIIGATGAMPNVSFPFTGVFDIALRVTDNTAAAFPTAGEPDQTDTDSTTVTVSDCSCIGAIRVRPKSTKNQLTWAPVVDAATYDIRRSTAGPGSGFSTIATGHVTNYATYLDSGLNNGTTYWYRVTPRDANGDELCGSEAVSGTPQARRRR